MAAFFGSNGSNSIFGANVVNKSGLQKIEPEFTKLKNPKTQKLKNSKTQKLKNSSPKIKKNADARCESY